MMKPQEFTKYEIARIIGARALQIAMDAPLLLNMDKETLERVKYDPIIIADMEFNSGVLPITVKRPMPKKSHVELKQKSKAEKTEEEKKKEEEKIEQEKIVKEQEEEKEISEEGEIMGLAKPEDEVEETSEEERATEEV